MNFDALIYLTIGIGIGTYCFYTLYKLRELRWELDNQPSIEDIAKEIVKIKIPISELPPEVLAKVKAAMNAEQGQSGTPQFPFQTSVNGDEIKRYTG